MEEAVTTSRTITVALSLALLLPACGLLSTREPEAPITDRGTFLQPDTPERVVDNIRFAISEQNTRNYRRSFADDLIFQPTATAEARDPIWSGWTATDEEGYYAALVSSVADAAEMSIELNDVSLTAIDADHFVYDATYVLTADHNRPETPTVFQGRLAWEIEKQSDGLWSVASWTDREVGTEPSWSDLKAAFTG